MPNYRQYQTAKGFSLIELLVALLMGSFVMASVVNLFTTNKLAYNLQQSVMSVQEEGRHAIQRLNESFADAGFSENGTLNTAVAIEATNGSTVARAGELFDETVILVDSGGTDCTNNTVTSQTWKHYSVLNKILICIDSNGNREIIAEQVEAFKIQYGINSSPIGTANFLSPNAFVKVPAAGQRIVSIRFALLLKSRNIVTAIKDDRASLAGHSVNLLDYSVAGGTGGNEVNFNDGFLRRSFLSTIRLRNFINNG